MSGAARTLGIWVFGLLACGIFGGIAGDRYMMRDGLPVGFLGGAFAFACARLWIVGARLQRLR